MLEERFMSTHERNQRKRLYRIACYILCLSFFGPILALEYFVEWDNLLAKQAKLPNKVGLIELIYCLMQTSDTAENP